MSVRHFVIHCHEHLKPPAQVSSPVREVPLSSVEVAALPRGTSGHSWREASFRWKISETISQIWGVLDSSAKRAVVDRNTSQWRSLSCSKSSIEQRIHWTTGTACVSSSRAENPGRTWKVMSPCSLLFIMLVGSEQSPKDTKCKTYVSNTCFIMPPVRFQHPPRRCTVDISNGTCSWGCLACQFICSGEVFAAPDLY